MYISHHAQQRIQERQIEMSTLIAALQQGQRHYRRQSVMHSFSQSGQKLCVVTDSQQNIVITAYWKSTALPPDATPAAPRQHSKNKTRFQLPRNQLLGEWDPEELEQFYS